MTGEQSKLVGRYVGWEGRGEQCDTQSLASTPTTGLDRAMITFRSPTVPAVFAMPLLFFSGEYSNLPLEELIDWIDVNVPRESSMAGESSGEGNVTLFYFWDPLMV